MAIPNISPLADIPVNPLLASLPKVDLHLHQEEVPRLERILARRDGQAPYDWRKWAQYLLANVPPGMNRLAEMYAPESAFIFAGVVADDEDHIVAKMVDALEEEAADGAILVEIRFGIDGQAMQRPDFMVLFREAERQVQVHYPQLRAEALAMLRVVYDPGYLQMAELRFESCLTMAGQGLAGIDFLVSPYESEADPSLWRVISKWVARAADSGVGITLHAGEFSTANLDAALRIPHLRRIGHAVHAVTDPRLLEQLVRSGITVECCLSCNVILGAIPFYEAHPMKEFVAAGVPVTLNTDDPVRIWTTIGREYAIAAALGFSPDDLLTFTRNAIRASFTSEARRSELLERLQQWHQSR
jgi:adenosine deaminase